MARIDKLLGTIQAKGAKALWLEPGQQPALELLSGARLALLPDPAPAGMLELLANEITPPATLEAFQTGAETRFDYETGGTAFRITLSRSAAGVGIQAEPLGPAAATPAAPEPPRITLDLDRTPGPPVALAPPPPPQRPALEVPPPPPPPGSTPPPAAAPPSRPSFFPCCSR